MDGLPHCAAQHPVYSPVKRVVICMRKLCHSVPVLQYRCSTLIHLTCPVPSSWTAPPSLFPKASILHGTGGMGIAYSLGTARIASFAVEPPAGAIGMAHSIILRRSIMTWSKPEFIDWRFGFEITLYIANR
ncbi:MAG: pyrroloquinoline quinone precursor peptide PqqA [Pseudomonadota bacterium]